jgi:hypothetical protein
MSVALESGRVNRILRVLHRGGLGARHGFVEADAATQSATFNIWSPASTYTGPDQLTVYWDTVYKTFVFYRD